MIVAMRVGCVPAVFVQQPGIDPTSSFLSTSHVESFASNKVVPSPSLPRMVRHERCKRRSAHGHPKVPPRKAGQKDRGPEYTEASVVNPGLRYLCLITELSNLLHSAGGISSFIETWIISN